jgi:hypothetical protein
MPKRNRALSIITVPTAVLLGLIGWVLFCVGSSRKELVMHKAEPRRQTELTFMVAIPEEIRQTI